MSPEFKRILKSKRDLRRKLAAKPIAEKLHVVEELAERALATRKDTAPTPPAEPWNIPPHWQWRKLGDVATIAGGGTPRTDRAEYFGGDIPWITPADLSKYDQKTISRGARNITREGLENSGARILPAGTVLFSSRAPIGYVAIAANPVATNQGFKSLILQEGILPDYAYYYLKRAKDLAVALASGTTFLEVSGKKASEIPIPVAPLPEQRRIVAEIEKQFTRLDAGVAALRRVQTNLKRYRAAVLKAACEGTLGARRESWPKQPVSFAIESMDQGWSPKCERESSQDENEWAVIKTTAIQGLRFLDDENKKLPSSLKPRPDLELRPGDLLVTRAGPRARVGVASLVKRTRPRLILCDKAYRLRCKTSIVAASFLEIMLNAPQTVDALDELKTGISDSGVNLTQTRFGELLVPLPSVSEQTRIVAEVERRLSVVEELEAVVSANLQRAAHLRQAILQKAFSGEL